MRFDSFLSNSPKVFTFRETPQFQSFHPKTSTFPNEIHYLAHMPSRIEKRPTKSLQRPPMNPKFPNFSNTCSRSIETVSNMVSQWCRFSTKMVTLTRNVNKTPVEKCQLVGISRILLLAALLCVWTIFGQRL